MNVAIYEQGPGFRSVWALFANKCGNIYEQGRSIYEQGATTGVALCVSRAEKDLRRGQREGLLVSLGWRPILPSHKLFCDEYVS